MIIKETKRGNEFITENLFSRNRISKDDRNLTKFLNIVFRVISFLHIKKLFQKASWFWLMQHHFGDLEEGEVKHPRIADKVILSNEDLHLEELVIYDLLPKEYLPEFKRRYVKFKKEASQQFLFNRMEKDVNDSFERMINSRVAGCWFNVDNFKIDEGDDLFEYFTWLSLHAIGLTESFYILRYTLRVNDVANDMLAKILMANVYRPVQCISNGKWWRRKSLAGCYTYDLGDDAKAYALEDFILELKSIFWDTVHTRLFSKVFSWDVIPPSIEIYSSQTLADNAETIVNFMCMRGGSDIEVNENNTVFFIPVFHERRGKGSYNSKIIASVSEFDGQNKNGLYSFLNVDEAIVQNLADYFVLDALNNHIDEAIYGAQLQINKTIYEKEHLHTFIKTKRSIDKKLYFFKRLYSEIVPLAEVKTKENYYFAEQYNSMFKNKYAKENPDVRYVHTFTEKYKSVFFKIKEQHNLMNEIYKHFKENSELIESRYNYKTVKRTLSVCFWTLIATILLANNSHLLKQLWDWICLFWDWMV